MADGSRRPQDRTPSASCNGSHGLSHATANLLDAFRSALVGTGIVELMLAVIVGPMLRYISEGARTVRVEHDQS